MTWCWDAEESHNVGHKLSCETNIHLLCFDYSITAVKSIKNMTVVCFQGENNRFFFLNRFTFAVKIKTFLSISRITIVWKCVFSAALYFHSSTFWRQIFCFFSPLNWHDNFIYELLCIFCDYLWCVNNQMVRWAGCWVTEQEMRAASEPKHHIYIII